MLDGNVVPQHQFVELPAVGVDILRLFHVRPQCLEQRAEFSALHADDLLGDGAAGRDEGPAGARVYVDERAFIFHDDRAIVIGVHCLEAGFQALYLCAQLRVEFLARQRHVREKRRAAGLGCRWEHQCVE